MTSMFNSQGEEGFEQEDVAEDEDVGADDLEDCGEEGGEDGHDHHGGEQQDVRDDNDLGQLDLHVEQRAREPVDQTKHRGQQQLDRVHAHQHAEDELGIVERRDSGRRDRLEVGEVGIQRQVTVIGNQILLREALRVAQLT